MFTNRSLNLTTEFTATTKFRTNLLAYTSPTSSPSPAQRPFRNRKRVLNAVQHLDFAF